MNLLTLNELTCKKKSLQICTRVINFLTLLFAINLMVKFTSWSSDAHAMKVKQKHKQCQNNLINDNYVICTYITNIRNSFLVAMLPVPMNMQKNNDYN